jgi:hypothetical protein
MIDVNKYKPDDTKIQGSSMILVDAVYFQRLIQKTNRVCHRLSLLFYHKRRDINSNGSLWDIWARILYMTPTYSPTKYTEFSKFFYALTGQEIKGQFNDDILRQMGLDLVNEIKNNNYLFRIEWKKHAKNFFYMNSIRKSDYVMERPAMIEWPKKVLEAYPEIGDARPVEED